MRAGGFQANGTENAKGEIRGREKKGAGGQWVRGAEGQVEASLRGVDGRGLAAPPQCPPARVGGAEGRGENGQCELTWSDWWVLSGLPAIFFPAARGVWAETKPSQSQDTVQTH